LNFADGRDFDGKLKGDKFALFAKGDYSKSWVWVGGHTPSEGFPGIWNIELEPRGGSS
jgi:hypothetical protein